MAKDPKPLEVLNAQARQAVDETKQATDRMKQAVEETKGQALGAADTYFDFLNKTISSFPSGGREFGEKLKSFAEKNLAATHQFIQQLSQAKDFQDVLPYRPSSCRRKCRLSRSKQRASPRLLQRRQQARSKCPSKRLSNRRLRVVRRIEGVVQNRWLRNPYTKARQ
jgi:hypothetical protein